MKPSTKTSTETTTPPVLGVSERRVDVTEAEIVALLHRHVKVCIDNASLITLWPLLDDMADVLLRVIGRDASEF